MGKPTDFCKNANTNISSSILLGSSRWHFDTGTQYVRRGNEASRPTGRTKDKERMDSSVGDPDWNRVRRILSQRSSSGSRSFHSHKCVELTEKMLAK
jgi:hypothetical protein